jgi:hypothetical protein
MRVVDRIDIVALLSEQKLHQAASAEIVVDDQYAHVMGTSLQ